MVLLAFLVKFLAGEQVALVVVLGAGGFVADLFGYGGHDVQGWVIFVSVNVVCYWAAALVALWLINRYRGQGMAGEARETPPLQR